MKKKISNMPKTLTVIYSGGIDLTLDRTIERLAGRKRDGSGMCVLDGKRDLSFTFPNSKSAMKAFGNLKKINGIKASMSK
jgi:hypothetical protein